MTDRPLAAVDLDGTLADFPETLLRVFNQRHGAAFGVLRVDDWTKYRIEDQYPPEIAERLDWIMREPGFFASLSPYPEVHAAIREILLFADVEICTMPPLAPMPHGRKVTDAHAAGDKVGWVTRHLPEVAADVTITHKKHRIRADALVDDSAKNIVKWCEAHPKGLGYLVARPWNRHAPLPKNARRGSLDSVAPTLREWLAKPNGGVREWLTKPKKSKSRARKASSR